jgi:adenylosuccinate lyase
MLREEAYRRVQGHALQAWETDGDFFQAVQRDSEIRRYLNDEQLKGAFSLPRQLKNVDAVFERVFSHST